MQQQRDSTHFLLFFLRETSHRVLFGILAPHTCTPVNGFSFRLPCNARACWKKPLEID